MADLKKLQQLREQTGVSVALCNKALIEAKGGIDKAKELLKQWGTAIAEKKQERETKEGIVTSYIHHNKKMGALITLQCETDFVAKNEDFQKLGYELAMQIASMAPKTTQELMKQSYIRDTNRTIENLIKEYIAKLGENIQLGDFVRFSL